MNTQRSRLRDFIGKSESLTLEFKSAAALNDSQTLPRAVCSLLNAQGGNIVVGLKDDGLTPDPVSNPEESKRRLEDILVSTITPPLPRETVIDVAADAPALVIRVSRGSAKGQLFAVRSTQGRVFVPDRIGARTRLLEWTEIVARLAEHEAGSTPRVEQESLLEGLDAWAEACESDAKSLRELGGLYLVVRAIASDPDSAIEPWSGVSDELRKLLIDPSPLGCDLGQAGFWDMRGMVQRNSIRKKKGSEFHHRSGSSSDGDRVLDLVEGPNRELRFATRLSSAFIAGQTLEAKRTSNLLNPYAISQAVSSCCRLFAHLLLHGSEHPKSVFAALDLRRLGDRRIPPGAPIPGRGYFDTPLWPPLVRDPGSVVTPELDGTLFLEKPDVAARRVLELFYMRSGWKLSDVPFFDAHSQRFVYT